MEEPVKADSVEMDCSAEEVIDKHEGNYFIYMSCMLEIYILSLVLVNL